MTVHSCRLLELEYEEKEGGRLFWEQILPSDILALVQPGDWQYYDPPRRNERNQCIQCRWNGVSF